MSVTMNFVRTFSYGSENLSATETITTDGGHIIDAVITNGGSAIECSIAFATAALKGFFMLSDQNITVKTNSSSSPQETITLVANVPFVWTTGSGLAIPFAGAITKIFGVNNSGTDANLKVRAALDVTP